MRPILLTLALAPAAAWLSPAAAAAQAGCPIGVGMFASYESPTCSAYHRANCFYSTDKTRGVRTAMCFPPAPRGHVEHHRRHAHHSSPHPVARERIEIESESTLWRHQKITRERKIP